MTQNNTHPLDYTPPFFYSKQVEQFRNFKKHTEAAWNNVRSKDGILKPSMVASTNPDYFATGLYFTTFGTNDFVVPLFHENKTVLQVREETSGISDAMVENTEELIKLGAKTIMVFNVPPLGCYPAFITKILVNEGEGGVANGCHEDLNAAISDTNSVIKTKLADLRKNYTDATIIYADFYSALLFLIESKSHGFTEKSKPCCGQGYDLYNQENDLGCGETKEIEGGESVKGKSCGDPGLHIHWDGVHITEAAAELVATELLDGHYTYPLFKLSKFCHLDYTHFQRKRDLLCKRET